MPRSTTIWAAALLLASMSGSGPLLTTAEAMPAPGPQVTQMRPKYYFPRHVKRQIVTNATAPATSTVSSSTTESSNSPELESRQSKSDLTSFFESLFHITPSQSSSSAPLSTADLTTTKADVSDPDDDAPPSSSNDKPQRPPPPSASTGGIPEVIVKPSSPAPVPSSSQAPPPPAPSSSDSTSDEQKGSTGGVPPTIVKPTSTSQSSPDVEVPPSSSAPEPPKSSASTGGIPDVVIKPSSSIELPSIGLPSIDLPKPSSEPPKPSSSVASTGGVPDEVITPSSSSPPKSSEPASTITGPFIIPGSTGGVPDTVVPPSSTSKDGLINLPTALLPSNLLPSNLLPTGTNGVLPSSIVLPTNEPKSTSDDTPVQPTTTGGIIVGITTAIGTSGSDKPEPTSAPIPTSEGSKDPLDLPSFLSSLLPLPTDPFPTGTGNLPTILPTSLPPLLPTSIPLLPTSIGLPSSLPLPSTDLPDLSSLLPSESPSLPPILPSTSLSVPPLPTTDLPPSSTSGTGILPPLPSTSGTGVLPPLPSTSGTGVLPPVPSSTGSGSPSPTGALPSTSGIVPPSTSGYVPTGSVSTDLPPASTVSSGIPTSEDPPSTAPVTTASPAPTNGTVSEPPSASIPIPTIPVVSSKTSKPEPIETLVPTATNSETAIFVGTSIVQESNTPSASATVSGIPSSLPKMLYPPEGMPSAVPEDKFLGQVCFKWPLNYPFVMRHDDTGRQIFKYLPMAIADALNITTEQVQNYGLKPLDTTRDYNFITTLAMFTIPKDLENTLASQIRNPLDAFWNNKNGTVVSLTNLINPSCALPVGKPLQGDPSSPNDPSSSSPGGNGNGGPVGGDMGASRKVNPTAAAIGAGTVMAALAYGGAMFFVARRYKNRKLAHQRSSSVPSSGRYTYGSIPGSVNWMSGAARGAGRSTPSAILPGSRGSRGSSSSNGRSVRTQQISAPVMAENSLGWN